MPAARTASLVFGLVWVLLLAFAASASAAEESDFFIDPSEPTLIRKSRVPFASQIILAASQLPAASRVHAAVAFSGQKFSYVAESPDGSLLAFSVDAEGHDWTGVLDLKDGTIRQVTLSFDSRALQPAWSGDGRFLAIEDEWGSGRRRLRVVELESGEECILDGTRLKNKFLNVSDPWWSEKGDKIYFKAEVNDAFRRSLGLKPVHSPARIGEADRQCRRTALHPVAEFIAEYPRELLPSRLSAIGLNPSPTP